MCPLSFGYLVRNLSTLLLRCEYYQCPMKCRSSQLCYEVHFSCLFFFVCEYIPLSFDIEVFVSVIRIIGTRFAPLFDLHRIVESRAEQGKLPPLAPHTPFARTLGHIPGASMKQLIWSFPNSARSNPHQPLKSSSDRLQSRHPR